MFFATFANLLSSIPTFLFPVFASYKALKSNDPALLQPWLMYWVVLAIALFVESWTVFILFWIPFYAWIRLGFLLYLILPQTQGAKVLYQQYVHPFLYDNELAIDNFISSAHDRAKAAGVTYLKQLIEYVKTQFLGLPPRQPTPPATPGAYSYAQSLFSRFNIPSARPASVATGSANDFYTLLASAVSAATSASGSSTRNSSRDLSNSETLIPPTVQGEDRLSFISAQRERLSILLTALDKEASNLSGGPDPSVARGGYFERPSTSDEHLAYGDEESRPKSGMSSRKSEVDFEKIDAESGAEELEEEAERPGAKRAGSWMPWSWGAKEKEHDPMGGLDVGGEGDVGRSSGVDL